MTEIDWIDHLCTFIMNHYFIYYLVTTILGLVALEWSFRMKSGREWVRGIGLILMLANTFTGFLLYALWDTRDQTAPLALALISFLPIVVLCWRLYSRPSAQVSYLK